MTTRAPLSPRYLLAAALIALCALLFALAATTPASAAEPPQCTSELLAKHEPCGFGSEGEGAGQFHLPRGVGVNQATGDVYFADRVNNRVESWSAAGAFRFAWGWGVADGTTPAFQTCEAKCFAGVPGAGAGQFGEFSAAGVAVDNSPALTQGDVYVVDPSNHRVQQFSASGEFRLMFGGEVNATTHADVCVAGEECQAGVPGSGPGEFQALGPNVIAVDSTGTVYVGEHERVEKFSPAGAFVGEVPLLGVGEVRSLAVDSAKDLYVMADGLEGVHKYDGAGTELPEPRDPTASPFTTVIAVGPGDDLFVFSPEQGHVQEFAPAGAQLSAFVEEGFSLGIAFGAGVGALYVLQRSDVVDVVPPPPSGPVVVAGSESVDGVLPTTAVAHALANPEGPEATSYHFEYGPTAAYGSSTEPVELTGGAFEDQPVSASLTGLTPGATYHYRVLVSNVAAQTTAGPDQTFTTAPSVSVESEAASQVSATSARLEATLNAHGLPSEYHFEYGTTTAYGQSAPSPNADAGSAGTGVGFGVLLEGLSPGTVYHYRVMAHNALGDSAGADQTFVTQAVQPTALADGRGWEMVSPPDKHGVSLESIARVGSVIQADVSGGGFTYIAKAPISSEPPGSVSSLNTQLLAKRSVSGWATADISTPHEGATGFHDDGFSEYRQFSPDLSLGAVEPTGVTPLAPALQGAHGEPTPYLRQANGEYVPLVTAANTPPGVKFGGEEFREGLFHNGVEFVWMTNDGTHVVLTATAPLTEGFASSGQNSLYEWSGGVLQLVSVLPNKKAAAEEGLSATVGNVNWQVRGAVSGDGSRIVFSTTGSGTSLYLRDVVRGETVRLDAPAGVLHPGSAQAVFQFGTADGSRVFFTDEARLTADSAAREKQADLYMCDITVVGGHLSCGLHDLTVDGNVNQSADVLGDVIGVGGEGGRFVYFVANGALAPGAVHGDCVLGGGSALAAASCNLYVRDLTAGVTRLVAVLSNRDAADWEAGGGSSGLGEMTAGVSGNGRWLSFVSSRSLTGYDNRDARSGEPDAEVFLFDRTSGALRCVSCNPSGARPVGVLEPELEPGLLVDRSLAWRGEWVSGLIPGWTQNASGPALYQSRYLSDSGRLFFDSSDALVPGDSNGLMDVYEFEPGGVGGCALASGCVSLMSSGGSGEESAFLDASLGGNDVFFLTAAKLAPQDTDKALDVYDAHVCSPAAPCPSAVLSVPPACTTADSCRSAPAPQPDAFGPPASSTFNGPGNSTQPTATKPAAKPLTRAQKLARALKACKKKPRRRRAACRSSAKRRYGPANAAARSTHTNRRTKS